MKMKETKKSYIYVGISPEAKTVFDAVAANYPDDIRIPIDFATLAIFADSVVRLEKLNKEIGERNLWYKTPNGGLAAHPARDEKSMLQKQIHYCSAKLGLTPDARNKIKLDLAEICKSEVATGRKYNRRKNKDEDRAEVAEEFC